MVDTGTGGTGGLNSTELAERTAKAPSGGNQTRDVEWAAQATACRAHKRRLLSGTIVLAANLPKGNYRGLRSNWAGAALQTTA
jgi:hypothetical protein